MPILDAQGRTGQFTVALALGNPSGAGLGNPSTSTLTITSSPGSLQFAASAVTEPESSGGVSIVVDRVGGASGTVTVAYATSPGSAIPGEDYVPIAGTLTFGPGVTQAAFTLPWPSTSTNPNDATVNLVLSPPGGGASLGSPSVEVVTIDKPLIVTGERMSAGVGGIGSVTLTFNKPLAAAQAGNLANFGYFAYWAGQGGRFVGGGKTTALAVAAYDPTSLSVTLVPESPLPLGHIYRIAVNGNATSVLQNGLVDSIGGPLVGSFGAAGEPYVVTFGAGRRLTYIDNRRQLVTLKVHHVGLVTLFQALDGTVEQIALVDSNPRRSRLVVTVSGRSKRTGRTTLPPVSVSDVVPIHLGASPLVSRQPGWRSR